MMFIFMIATPIGSAIILEKKRQTLDDKEVRKKIGNLYQDVKLQGRGRETLWYYPIFMLRRIMFVAIPTFLYNYPFG